MPISGSASSAWLASGGLQAPRMVYGSRSTPSFFFSVPATSMVLSTPKPCAPRAAVTAGMASSWERGTRTLWAKRGAAMGPPGRGELGSKFRARVDPSGDPGRDDPPHPRRLYHRVATCCTILSDQG